MGKYDPLRDHLDASTEPVVALSFVEIERIIGDTLPASARTHPAWWANESPGGMHSHARCWLDSGYQTRRLDLNAQTIEFVASGAGR